MKYIRVIKSGGWILGQDFHDVPISNKAIASVSIEPDGNGNYALPIQTNGPKDRLKFVFSPALTQEELDQVALIKSADDGDFDHRNTEADSLAIAKVLKKGKIDARTVDLINAGFTFASRLFSLSPNARDNWIALYAGKAALTYPITVTAQDGDGRFSIPDAATLEGIYLTGIGVVGALLAAGRDLKDDIDELTTIAAVEAFEDPR